jgi:uncharacterized iron-regulated membrane protein
MKPHVVNRKVHYWLALAVAVPALVIIASGVLLQVKKQVRWVQPAETRGTGGEPALTLDQVLAIARTVPEAAIETWADIDRVDVRPAKGMLKVVARNRYEIQVDLASGAVLQVAYRRSDLIESIHDGSFFHPAAKLGVFLPAGIILFLMLASGVYLFLQPILARRKRKRRLEAARREGGLAAQKPRSSPADHMTLG